MFPTASPFRRIKSIINTSGWEVGSCPVLDTVWGGFPVGSRWALAWVPLALPCRFLLGSRWVPGGLRVGSSRSSMQCKVGSRWAPGGVSLLCHVVWSFGVGSEVGWAASCRHTHQKKSGATTLNGSAELRRLRALGSPKPAPSNTYREETGSYHLASFGHYGNPCLRKARCHLLPSSKTGSCG